MIDAAVRYITRELNQYLARRFSVNEDVALVSNLAEQDGNIAVNISNKVAVFLVNIEKDTTPYQNNDAGSAWGKDRFMGASPLHLNLFLMFSANFSGPNYPEALKFLSHTISFFQKHPVFTRQNSPQMDPRIEKLILDMENLNIKDLSSLWSILSGKYQPSVLYRVRMLTFDGADVKARVRPLSEPSVTLARDD